MDVCPHVVQDARAYWRTATVALLLLAVATVGTGNAAAHNPGCIQTGHADGPHYGKDTAFVHNPTLRGPDNEDSLHPDHAKSIHNREGSCSVGNSQSPHSDG